MGAIATTIGTCLHLPMYLAAAPAHFRMAGMAMDVPMKCGMALIGIGLAMSLYGLYPQGASMTAERVSSIRVRALDDARLGWQHIWLLLVMALAVTIDVMKPTTLAFVVPGMSQEYGLKSPLIPNGTVPVALLPFSGITGTVLGSFMWGWLGDRIGRRASILLAAITFVSTSICGAMPSYLLNFLMCFIMGIGVGGMLPVSYSLIAEIIPARHRGLLMVLVGGDLAAAYVITSWLASALVPIYSWRILWLLGLPTGLLLILLNRWIPESPRFLIATGQEAEASEVMRRYGGETVDAAAEGAIAEADVNSAWAQLALAPLVSQTALVSLLGVGIGLVLFGFNLWIPLNLRKLGFTEVSADRMLRDSALMGFPFTFVVAWMYGMWSSRKTLILLSALTAAALLGFAVTGNAVVEHRVFLYLLLVLPIWGINTVTAVLSVYASEVYPTQVRSRGSGLAAGTAKAGGVLIIALVVLGIATPSIATTTMIGAVPMGLAALLTVIFGLETRQRRLEEISAGEFALAPAQPQRSLSAPS
jgi:putative MFS transporter